MFEWNKKLKALVVILLCTLNPWLSFSLHAEPFVCMSDMNANGSIDAGEYQTCTTSNNGHLCPINRTACVANASGAEVCPLGNFACMDDGAGGRACSSSACYDEATAQTTNPGTSTASYTDDGQRDAAGNCLANQLLFNGSVETCNPAGTSNGWKNCCANDSGEVYVDSSGGSVEDFLTNKMITVAANAAYAAASAYATALSSGATTAEAGSAASTAATNEIMVAFDPTSLVIAIIIYLVMSYLMKACPADQMETALKNDSGYCHFIGTHCVKEMFGSCTQDEEVYCCFNSKLARIIQEQGRPQIPAMGGWGTVEEPNCRGFAPQEFQSLDFSRIDFSEYYAELRHKTESTIRSNIGTGINDYQNRDAVQ